MYLLCCYKLGTRIPYSGVYPLPLPMYRKADLEGFTPILLWCREVLPIAPERS